MTAAGVAAVSPSVLVPSALAGPGADICAASEAVSVVAVGKAAAAMDLAFRAAWPGRVVERLAIGPVAPPTWDDGEWITGGHPFATAGSAEGGRRALAVAGRVPAEGGLVLLLSGGASALMAVPAVGLTLEDKQATARTMMAAGAAITELNTVRKHLSAIKGGRLAAACAGSVVTLALSDVVGDDLSVIGSGPAVPDQTTWHDARAALAAFGGLAGHAAAVVARVEAGCAGRYADTPKADDPSMRRVRAQVIGGRRQAMAGAAAEAERRGYQPVVLDAAVVGEARYAAPAWWQTVAPRVAGRGGRLAVISSGETTVKVGGPGRGGRNQEFALALAVPLADAGVPVMVASAGTDGVDGPTDAGGALVDSGTLARARAAGVVEPAVALDRNDSYGFFAPLGDLWQPGPTGTNVGDLQVLLVDAP
ncbi:MAG: glycerate kinase [Vicinamibacterales bacterium]